ncbi:sodium:calcium antiporter [Aspergillus fischeri NRRL 181]|uniref:Sodium/calcium transporter, putative n=1 Tax=Neosartorya fischeri (strain ATCC 1020 / DSM 3700 / CBS 544.65 / FGSC A1164 / JCM 1740 / NRRL 181 / WB 181) TaxID=331117 RepID=A1CY62_NEOFI|nr:sodium/calcium transporter, putative [Aspergillus fischeri NRRL 181]EAW23682.1 sodium/calcium transporter, putative [Aspergillus fischeri NRRL 181]
MQTDHSISSPWWLLPFCNVAHPWPWATSWARASPTSWARSHWVYCSIRLELTLIGCQKYAAVLLAVTTLFVLLALFNQLNKIVGSFPIALFGIYVLSIFYAIYIGVAAAPELADSDSDAESTDGVVNSMTEATPLLESQSGQIPERSTTSLLYHVTQLLFGLIALSLAGYFLSHSAVSIADSLHLSGTVFGLTIVSFATTLPEKLIAVVSGSRGHVNILAVTTAGSNIFLLTLCAGVVALAGDTRNQSDTFVLFDLITVWVSSLGFFLVVILGLGRIAGVIFLAAYVTILALVYCVQKMSITHTIEIDSGCRRRYR